MLKLIHDTQVIGMAHIVQKFIYKECGNTVVMLEAWEMFQLVCLFALNKEKSRNLRLLFVILISFYFLLQYVVHLDKKYLHQPYQVILFFEH